MEPLLERVSLHQRWLNPAHASRTVSWTIIGGESGAADRRPFDVSWALDLIDECRTACVPVFVKQLGSHPIHMGKRLHLRDKKGGDPSEWPHELHVRQFPRVKVTA